MPRRLLTCWRRTCNRSPLAGSSREYPNTIPTPPTILSRRSAPASGASALIRESERMHTPGQFGPPAISAFAPLCTKRERSQIGTGNRVRTGEFPIRVDQFLAIRAEKLWPEPSAENSTPKKTTPCPRPTRWRARCTCIARHDLPLTVVMLRRDVDANDQSSTQTINSGDRPEPERSPALYEKTHLLPRAKNQKGQAVWRTPGTRALI